MPARLQTLGHLRLLDEGGNEIAFPEKAELETDDGALETLKLSVAEQKELEQRETTLRLAHPW